MLANKFIKSLLRYKFKNFKALLNFINTQSAINNIIIAKTKKKQKL